MHMDIFICKSVHTIGMSDACEGQKSPWDPLELDIEIVVNHHVILVIENQPMLS